MPNITGYFTTLQYASMSVSGAFTVTGIGNAADRADYNDSVNKRVYFNASRCSDIYSDDVETVQPPAVTVRFIIKY